MGKKINTHTTDQLPSRANFSVDPKLLPSGFGNEFAGEEDTFTDSELLLNMSLERKQSTDSPLLSERFFTAVGRPDFPSDLLILNDIVLSDVPTNAISIEQTSDAFVAETLRSKAPVVASFGYQDIRVNITLSFRPGDAQTNRLHRLMAEITKHPLVYVFNNYIRDAIGINDPSETSIFILKDGTLRSDPDHVGTIILDLSMNYFNYKPFSNHFWYNTYLPWIDRSRQKRIEQRRDIGDLTSYEPSSHSLDYEAYRISQDIRDSVVALRVDEPNIPINMPSASDAWMYYANHLSDLSPPITSDNSDFVGFRFKEYEHHAPPNEIQRLGHGKIPDIFGPEITFPSYAKIYDIMRQPINPAEDSNASKKQQRQTSSDRYAEALASQTSAENRPPIVFKRPATGATFTLQLLDDQNNIIPESHRAFSEICYSPKEKNTLLANKVLMDSKLIYLVQNVADKYPGRDFYIYSGIRGYKKGKHQHALARAIDFKLQGVSNDELFISIAGLMRSGGIGYYPNNHPSGGSQFVHMDSRPTKGLVMWVDESKRGEKEKANKNHPILVRAKRAHLNKGKTVTLISNQAASDERTHLEQEYKDKLVDRSKQISDLANSDTLNPLPKSLDPASGLNRTIIKSKNPRSLKARTEWLLDMSKQGLSYYWDDPKIRNVFFQEFETNITSNRLEQNNSLFSKNIVFSAVSISFGHRIVPHKLVGQDSYTWQFLGAGNKTGTMVFSFAGQEGRASANSLKKMFLKARENARLFSNRIQDAGAIELIRRNPLSAEQNNILALLDIRHIIITEVSETNSPDGSDKFQLVVSFIVQDFADERADRHMVTDINTKRRIIRTIMSYLVPWKPPTKNTTSPTSTSDKDKQYIRPDPQYVEFRTADVKAENKLFNAYGKWFNGEGRPIRFKKGFPPWLGVILETASKYCQQTDDAIPPTKWKTSKGSQNTWSDRYSAWGDSKGVIKGRIDNIAVIEQNSHVSVTFKQLNPGGFESRTQLISEAESNRRKVDEVERMLRNDFDHDGGSVTNDRHESEFIKWLNKMDILVNDVRKHMTEPDFDKWFDGIGKEMIDSITERLGECYDDMELPDVPTGTIPLPPEFYIYDDSREDPAISSLTDDQNMSMFLRKHIKNERASVERYIKGTLLGGSYLSSNLPKIMESRLDYLNKFAGEDRSSGEFEFMSFSRMLSEGTKAWEPVFYRPTEDTFQTTACQKWINRIKNPNGTGGNTETAQKTFMDNLITLSPYLKDDRLGWKQPYNASSDTGIIDRIYDDNWRKIAFGPNPEYKIVDEVMEGNIPDSRSQLATEIIKKTPEQEAEETKQVVLGPDMVQLEDGSVAYGKNAEEFGAMVSDTMNGFTSDALSTAGSLLFGAAEVGSVAAIGAGLLLGPFGLPLLGAGAVLGGVALLGNAIGLKQQLDQKASRTEIANLLSDLDHNAEGDKFTPETEDIRLADMAAGIALGSKSKDLSVRRAYPTFKIYFIEDDTGGDELIGGRVVRAFDDFYSYSAVQEIRIIRSREVASDLAILRITNVAGKLLRRRWGEKSRYELDREAKYGINREYETGIFADTEKENPFERMVLQDGVKVQIRLGFASNPDHLETTFLGSIVEIQPAEDGKILQIVCQGFGAELENVELGPLEDGPIFYSSQQVLSGAIIQNSIVNFGRRDKFNRFVTGKMRHQFTGGEGRGLLASLSPTSLLQRWGEGRLDKHFFRYNFRNYPQDDNIFAPPPDVYTNTWMRFWDNACTYRPLKQTPWQIFKEHELRHPGYISLAVPYGHSSTMTMFFGAKGQHYWAHPPSSIELFLSTTSERDILKMRGLSQAKLTHPDFVNKLHKLSQENSTLANAVLKGITSFARPTDVSTEIGKMFGRYRPFRNYHHFTSAHHILKNTIRTNRDGVFNEVEVLYFEDGNDISEDDPNDLHSNLTALRLGDKGALSCKLDENIPEEYIRSYREEFPSCITIDMARRYVQGLFARLLRKAYSGELIVLGEPTLKPYDICTINDTSISMQGPIEVRSVEHIFNRDHGFISIITPDLCVDINDYYSVTVSDLIGSSLAYSYGFRDIDTAITLSAMASPLGFLAYAGAVKLAKWTQQGVPVITTPLVLEGKPFTSVSLGQKRTSLILGINGKWEQHWDDLSAAWDRFDVAEGIFDANVSIQEQFVSFLSGANIDESIPPSDF